MTVRSCDHFTSVLALGVREAFGIFRFCLCGEADIGTLARSWTPTDTERHLRAGRRGSNNEREPSAVRELFAEQRKEKEKQKKKREKELV